MRRATVLAVIAALALLDAAPMRAQVTVGNPQQPGGNCWPFCPFFITRYQQAYAASAFDEPLTIGSLTLFHTGALGLQGAGIVRGTYALALGVTSNPVTALTSDLSDQADVVPFQHFATLTDIPADETTFTMAGNSFFYDPSLGNLILDLVPIDPQSNYWVDMDACSGVVGRAALWDDIPIHDCFGFVTRFDVATTTTPEPGSALLMGTAVVGLLGVWRRRAAPDVREQHRATRASTKRL